MCTYCMFTVTCFMSAVGPKEREWTKARVVARPAYACSSVVTNVVDTVVRRRLTLFTRVAVPV